MQNLKPVCEAGVVFQLIHSSVILFPLIATGKHHLQICQADAFFGLKLKPVLALETEKAHAKKVKLQ